MNVKLLNMFVIIYEFVSINFWIDGNSVTNDRFRLSMLNSTHVIKYIYIYTHIYVYSKEMCILCPTNDILKYFKYLLYVNLSK